MASPLCVACGTLRQWNSNAQVWVSAPRLHAALRNVRHAWRPVDDSTWRSTLQARSALACGSVPMCNTSAVVCYVVVPSHPLRRALMAWCC